MPMHGSSLKLPWTRRELNLPGMGVVVSVFFGEARLILDGSSGIFASGSTALMPSHKNPQLPIPSKIRQRAMSLSWKVLTLTGVALQKWSL